MKANREGQSAAELRSRAFPEGVRETLYGALDLGTNNCRLLLATPAVGGFSTAQMLYLLRGLTGLNLVAADVVEVIPAYDVAQITALAAAQVVFECLALLAVRRRAATA